MTIALTADNDSDYGWDLSLEEEALLTSLNAHPLGASTTVSPVTSSCARRSNVSSNLKADINAAFAVGAAAATDEPAVSLLVKNHRDFADIDHGFDYGDEVGFLSREAECKARVASSEGSSEGLAFIDKAAPRFMPLPAEDDISYPDLSSAMSILSRDPKPEPEPEPEVRSTTLSPLARFRTFPKKPFSVSDLTAGAWCELQYEYTLTRLPGGRRTRTPAMKAGTKLHKELEDEVHVTVKVDITTKEDAFGLKLWNMIQGLRTLRGTGLTREMEVWGVVDGHIVNGIIDSLSYRNPNPDFEEEILSSQGSKNSKSQGSEQQKITHFFPAGTTDQADTPGPKIFLTDVKTRGTDKPPSVALMRPAKIQLFLYHRFLSEMASGKLDFLHVIRRYGLDPDEPFSDIFMAQIGSLHDEVFYDTQQVPPSTESPASPTKSASSVQSESELLRYRTLRALLPLLKNELCLTFPQGAESLGVLVTVEYRLRPRHGVDGEWNSVGTGQLIKYYVIPMVDQALDDYLGTNMEWWRGERQARGVDIEEATYKCGFCEFAEICDWRKKLDEERLEKARDKLASKADAAYEEDGEKGGKRRKGKILKDSHGSL